MTKISGVLEMMRRGGRRGAASVTVRCSNIFASLLSLLQKPLH